jgi:mannitol-1-phosphate/altronate dehydrogenase
MWQNFAPRALVAAVLKNEDLWGTNLSSISGLEEKIAFYLESMEDQGVYLTLEKFLQLVQPIKS